MHSPDATGNSKVEINKHNALGRSYLQIARTLVHEAIRAELFRKRQEMVNSGQEPDCKKEEPTSFEELWCYYLFYMTPLDSENYQHEYMADHYVKSIAAALGEMHPELSSQRFIDLMIKGLYALDGTRYDWKWQEFFHALTWQGLEETLEYKNVIENDSESLKKQKAYLEASQMEPDKCN
ncbi:hypothetical protein ADICEAN_04025 [Cesiribacter andamanensis AMV16]|uniref:Uncharacterized protein n=1 Tax=Cesiribacter andamanensis AMV16 TaxID=1279009 RepID=M7NGA5_9BACT|nr:hypothetical protein ADICEAN_04025 [Cesiribacter andamanensis AMV16]